MSKSNNIFEWLDGYEGSLLMNALLFVALAVVFSVIVGVGFLKFLSLATRLTIDQVCEILMRPFNRD